MKTLPLFLALISFISLANATGQDKEIYTWIDENGITHFGDAPVQGNEAEVINQDGNNNVASLAPKVNQWQQDYQQDKEAKAEEKKLLAESNEKKGAYCQRLKQDFALFNNGGRIYNTSADGERSFYSDDAIAKELEQLSNKLKKNKCR